MEGVWSLFKRSHDPASKHIDPYLSELEWQSTNRDNPRIFINTLQRILTTDAMPHAELTADTEAV